MKKYKIDYNDGILEVIIRDETGCKIEHFKANWRDTKRHAEIAARLKNKYGIVFEPNDFFQY